MLRKNKNPSAYFKMKTVSITTFLFLYSTSYVNATPNQGLCSKDEINLFDCNIKNKNASLCINEAKNRMQYRIGTWAKKDFIYPQTPKSNEYSFRLSTTPYPGGGENRIRFANGIYNYFIYDITRSQQDGTSIDSIQTAGIAVYENGKRIASLKCENSETSISPLAFEILQREEFSHDINTD